MKKTFVLWTCLALLATSPALADDTLWTRMLQPGEGAFVVAVRCQGTDAYLSGSKGMENTDLFAAKYSGTGVLQWSTTIDLDTIDIAQCLAVGPDQSPVLGGGTGAGMEMLGLIVKLSPAGETLWTRTRANTMVVSVVADNSNNIFAIGACGGLMLDSLWLARYDASGNQDWSKTLKLAMMQQPTGICIGGSGNLVAAVNLMDTISQTASLVKFSSSSGETLWTRQYPEEVAMRFSGITATGSNFLIVGDDQTGSRLYKCGPTGDTIWTTGLPQAMLAPDIAADGNGNSYVAYTDEDLDYKLNKYDPDGQFLGTGRGGSSYDDMPVSLATGSDNYPVVTGMALDTLGTVGVFTVKFSGTPASMEDHKTARPRAPLCRLLGTVLTNRHLRLQVETPGTYWFEVINPAGRVVHTHRTTVQPGLLRLPLPRRAAGVHFLRVQAPGRTQTLEFVVSR